VTQLQTTLAAVQDLLIQQQQKIQDLTQELAASKVSTSNSSPLEHHRLLWNMHGFFCGHMESILLHSQSSLQLCRIPSQFLCSWLLHRRSV